MNKKLAILIFMGIFGFFGCKSKEKDSIAKTKTGIETRKRVEPISYEKQIEVLKQEIRSEIRIIHNQIDTKRKAVEYYRDIIIPVHEDVVQASQKEYNFMLLGAYTLLEVKQDEINARRNYILTLRDYWILRTDLEHAGGVELSNK